MSKNVFDKLDLNLIKVFFILYQELNTYKAAEILHTSQPAISRSLQKLRDAFDDALFVKTRHGMLPTEKADYLAQVLPQVWQKLEETINHSPEFHLADLKGKLRCAIHPSVLDVVSQHLSIRLNQLAPNVELIISQWDKNTATDLAEDKLDFAVSIFSDNFSKEISQKMLQTLTAKIYLNKLHPLANEAITEKNIVKYPIAILNVKGWNDHLTNVERILMQYKLTPTIRFRSPHPSAVISVVSQTDYLHPAVVEYIGIDKTKVAIQTPTLNGEPILFDCNFCHHYRHRNKPLYKWLYDTINEALVSKS